MLHLFAVQIKNPLEQRAVFLADGDRVPRHQLHHDRDLPRRIEIFHVLHCERQVKNRHIETPSADRLRISGDQPQLRELCEQDVAGLRCMGGAEGNTDAVLASQVARQVEQQSRGAAHVALLRIDEDFHDCRS